MCLLLPRTVKIQNSPAKTGIDHVSPVTAYGPLEFKNCTDPIFADPHYFIIRSDYDANRATHPTELHVTQVSTNASNGAAYCVNGVTQVLNTTNLHVTTEQAMTSSTTATSSDPHRLHRTGDLEVPHKLSQQNFQTPTDFDHFTEQATLKDVTLAYMNIITQHKVSILTRSVCGTHAICRFVERHVYRCREVSIEMATLHTTDHEKLETTTATSDERYRDGLLGCSSS
jgi:hypothetical protein